MSSSPSSSHAARKNVSTACETCRRRRCKCDGGQPRCDVCTQNHRECTYGDRIDRRTQRLPQTGIAVLQNRVAELEAELAIARATSNIGFPASPSSQHDRHATINGITSGCLSLETSGVLRFVGPTSTFFRTSPSDLKHIPRIAQMTNSRYLPIAIDFHLHNIIIDRAFLQLDWAEIIIEDQFRLGLTRSSAARTNHFSPFLHLVVLAIGCRYLDQEEAAGILAGIDIYETRGDLFANTASGMIVDECSDPNLGTIRGLLALTGYKSGRAEDRLAVMYLGLALNLAQDFRLHLRYNPDQDTERPVNSKDIDADRIHCLWTCSMADSLWSSYLGRESKLPRSYFTQPLPSISNPDGTPLVRLIHNHHARLSHISSQAVEAIYVSSGTTNVRFGQMQRYNGFFVKWSEDLPLQLQLPMDGFPVDPRVITLHAYYQASIIVIHRPFLGPIFEGQYNTDITSTCTNAAYEVVRLLKLQRNIGVKQGPLINQHSAFIAGLILVMVTCGMTGTPALNGDESAEALGHLEEITTFLGEFSEVWQNARQSADALLSLMGELIMPVVDMSSLQDVVPQ